jgi:predicted nucleotidyltransferase component of viral defense system
MSSHYDVLDDVLAIINKNNSLPYVLKGRTALVKCYGMDRMSEDIDLDASTVDYSQKGCALLDIIAPYCKQQGYLLRIAKDTDFVKRIMIACGGDKPLKVELSLRSLYVPSDNYLTVNGIVVYDIDNICQMKVAAYLARDKIRDLFDLTFILNEHFSALSRQTCNLLRAAFTRKDLSQFDYLVATQSDPLIDTSLLEERFLKAFEILDLSAPKPTNKTSELTFKHFKDAATSEASAKQNETRTRAQQIII